MSSPMQIIRRDAAPGATAIATALAAVHGHAQPHHWGPTHSVRDGGEDPLDGVSAFPSNGHWHYVTYGLTQQRAEDTSFPFQPGLSGFGFELTFRLAHLEGQPPPVWPVVMLQRLARYVFRSSNVFRPGDHMDLQLPMGGDARTELRGALFTDDPQVGPVETAHGLVRFVQVVGVTLAELEAVKDWSCEGFLRVLSERDPFFVTDLLRPDYLADASFAQACRQGARIDGSSHGSSFATAVNWNELLVDGSPGIEVVVGAIAVPDLRRALRLRLPYNRPFRLHGRRASIRFVPALAPGFKTEGPELVLGVPWDAAAGLAETLRERRGRYEWPGMPRVSVVVEPTDVRGARGELLRVLG
ncbi:MAG: suppressor of fused domain protein [Sandaracinus sp.]|nr:suppressor of fused domain protein [Myxococcales bacterium]MCB9602701.1 suppressor of fused domain protein [Sandaracinus sp.]MCB9617062.1 suppressor of fused domain protein [Sandaracinus sp.]MCB9632117.1 suppressor of fused domain protein [Sandaracinus sp.]